MIFQHFLPTKVWEHKFNLPVKRSKVILGPSFEKMLVDLSPPMLYTKIQPKNFLGSGENFQEFFTIYRQGSHFVQWFKTT